MQFAQTLGLAVVDLVMIGGVAGASRHPLYAARVVIPSLEVFQFGALAFAGLNLVHRSQLRSERRGAYPLVEV